MKKKRRITISQKIIPFSGHFPPEILPEILAKLPVKSLLRFRCVSSTFRNTIDNPNFMFKHLNCYNRQNNPEKLHLLTPERATFRRINFTTRKRDTFRKVAQHMITSLASERVKWPWPCAGVDGLILLISDSMLCDRTLQVCNPSIRKSLPLPRCPLSLWTPFSYALGFAPSSNDYKVVIFVLGTAKKSGPEFAVIELSDGRWRRRRRSSTDMMDVDWWSSCCSMQHHCVSTKEAANWLVVCKKSSADEVGIRVEVGDRYRFTHVVSFDFDTEEVSYVELPDDHRGEQELLWFVFSLGESVAVLGISPVWTYIWVMEDKDQGRKERPWKIWYSEESNAIQFAFFQSNRDAKILYFEQNDELLLKQSWSVARYNLRSHEIEPLLSTIEVCDIYVHAESLLLSTRLDAQTLPFFTSKENQWKVDDF